MNFNLDIKLSNLILNPNLSVFELGLGFFVRRNCSLVF